MSNVDSRNPPAGVDVMLVVQCDVSGILNRRSSLGYDSLSPERSVGDIALWGLSGLVLIN